MKKEFLSFEESKKIASNLNFKGSQEWKKYCRENIRIPNIPIYPNNVYKTEWKGWRSFLGTDFLPFQEARKIASNAKLKEKRNWSQYAKSHQNLKLPSNPNLSYKNKGWVSWYDFLDKRTDARKYSTNESFFKTWSCNMFYILGLWWADGFICKNIFSITLQKKDCYLLSIVLEKMNSTYPVRKYDNYGVFSIRSKNIVDSIKELGGIERKSLIIDFPNIPIGFLSDFIRGLWDGDGCIHINTKTKVYRAMFTSGSIIFIHKLHNILKENIKNLGGCIVKHKKANCYSLSFSKNDAIRLRDFIYQHESELKLIRKYDKFISLGKKSFFKHKDMITFEEAKRFIKQYNLKNSNEWNMFWKNNKKPSNISISPSRCYKNEGWISWPDFLGYKPLLTHTQKTI